MATVYSEQVSNDGTGYAQYPFTSGYANPTSSRFLFKGWRYNGILYTPPYNSSNNPFGPITGNTNIEAVFGMRYECLVNDGQGGNVKSGYANDETSVEYDSVMYPAYAVTLTYNLPWNANLDDHPKVFIDSSTIYFENQSWNVYFEHPEGETPSEWLKRGLYWIQGERDWLDLTSVVYDNHLEHFYLPFRGGSPTNYSSTPREMELHILQRGVINYDTNCALIIHVIQEGKPAGA